MTFISSNTNYLWLNTKQKHSINMYMTSNNSYGYSRVKAVEFHAIDAIS